MRPRHGVEASAEGSGSGRVAPPIAWQPRARASFVRVDCLAMLVMVVSLWFGARDEDSVRRRRATLWWSGTEAFALGLS